MLQIVIPGAAGRMGQELVKAITADPSCNLCGTTQGADDDFAATLTGASAIIDFTAPEGTLHHATLAAEHKIPLVIGTTGFSDAQMAQLRQAATSIPVVFSPNMSVGVNLFWYLAAQMARRCGAAYQFAIEETHHIHKKDAPSGTAKQLHYVVAEASGRDPASIPVQSHREGEVIGDHSIVFDSTGDRLTIAHHAKERAIFARGALVAAAWVVKQPKGWYGMKDVLGIEETV